MTDKMEIEDVIDKGYSLDTLRKLYRDYLFNFDNESEEIRLDTKGIDFAQQKAQKKSLVNLLAEVFTNPEYFEKLLTIIPEDVRKVFKILTWDGAKLRAEELEKDLELKILTQNTSNYRAQDINPAYLFFGIDRANSFNMSTYEYKLYLPAVVRETLKRYFEPPEGYDLIPLQEIEETDYVYENKAGIIKYLQLYYNYVNSGNINFSKQDRASKGSLKNLKEYCEIKEFYTSPKGAPENQNKTEDKELEFLRTELIINFLKDLNLGHFENTVDLLKEILHNFIGPNSPFFLDTLLLHIKGKGDLRKDDDFKSRNHRVRNSIFNLVNSLPLEQWVSIENIIKFTFYRNLFFKLIDENFAAHNLYFDETKRTSNTYTYGQKTYIKEDNYNDILVIPLIKAAMFLFAAFGIVDIAYNQPKNNLYKQKNQDYLSLYDGVKYVRLTELGGHLAGLTEDFEIEIEKEEIDITLDEDRLMLKIDGKDKYKILFIESFAEKISENRYKVNYSTFLNGCSSREEIETKIKFFKAEIDNNPPKIWNIFFEDILKKADPLKKKDEFNLYQVKADPDLLNLLIEDEILSKYILKVENSNIAIKDDNLPDIRKRLEEFGYLISNQ
jgi:hypothetical protein